MIRRLLVVVAVACFGLRAEACESPANYDTYLAQHLGSLPAVYAKSATIDRVRVVAPPKACELWSGSCKTSEPFRAHVLERVKGASPDDYPLAVAPSDIRTQGARYDSGLPKLSDGRRGFPAADGEWTQHIAKTGHRSDGFWDGPYIAPNTFGGSCGKYWALNASAPPPRLSGPSR